jgi:Hemerythrin HHE cation binding domain
MTRASLTAQTGTYAADAAPSDAVPANPHTLAGEHAMLLRDVVRRTAPLQAVLDARTWPHAELGALINFLRATVLRQASDEETLLFPHDSSAPPLAELSLDHARLHTLTTKLEAAHAEPCSRGELRALIEELLATLRRHLADEEDVLGALPQADTAVPSAADLAVGRQTWLRDDDTPVLIRLDTLPETQAAQLCIERLLRLRPGKAAEVHAGEDRQLRVVHRWLRDFDPMRYGLSLVTIGREHVLRVTCRRANAPAGIGYPG